MSLRQQAFKGIMWNLTDNLAVQVIQFVTSIYMARILSPSDYGLMGMLLIFTALSDAIMNGGFSTALIRKIDRTDTDAATAFYFNIVVGLMLYGGLFLLAPSIAAFYKIPLLQDLIKVAAIPFVVNAFFLVQRTYLTIRMDFKTQSKISVVSALAKGGTGIGMAYAGYGVWAIAWSGVAGAVVSCILYWWHSVWKLRLCFSWRSFRELFGFGSKLMLSGVLDVLGNNLFTLIIGKKFAASSLGYYTRAYGYAYLPVGVLSGVLSRVTLPMLSRIQEDDERLAKVYQQMLNLAAFVTFPLMTGLALLARPLIVLMITDKWLPCVEYLQILCFAFMLYPIHALNLNLLQVKGRSDLFLRLEVIKKVLMLALLLIALPFGIRAICISGVIASLLALILNTYYTGKLIKVGFFKQVRGMLPIGGYTLVMSICMYITLQMVKGLNNELLWGTIVGAISFLVSIFCFQAKEWLFIVKILHSKLSK